MKFLKIKKQKKEDKLGEFPEVFLESKIDELPTLLEFFGFVYFFGSFLAGPAIHIHDYLNLVNGKTFNDWDKEKIPSTILPSLKKSLLSLIFLPSFLIVSAKTFDDMVLKEFAEKSLFFYKYSPFFFYN